VTVKAWGGILLQQVIRLIQLLDEIEGAA